MWYYEKHTGFEDFAFPESSVCWMEGLENQNSQLPSIKQRI
jgi:hypothetical protein